jgi:inhibitor of cysteine peptidase
MRIVCLGLALALSACAPKAPEPMPTPDALAAPVAGGLARTITEAEAGKTVPVAVGERIAVALVGIPTAGYLWAPVAPPDFLAADGEGGGPTTQAQQQPGFTGGNHWEVFYFKVAAPGAATLRFEQRRPWETGQPPDDVFEVRIEAK